MQGLHKLLLFHVLTCLGRIAHGSDIIHGEKAPANSMQYMASVQNSRGHHCGGFLITEDFVVTAAHCQAYYPSHVVLGTHDLKGNCEKIQIDKRFMPLHYQNVESGDDIMLLKLSSKATLGSRVKTIPLPSSEANTQTDKQCSVAGWGKTSTNGEAVDDLRVVQVSVVDPAVCKQQWPALPDNVICAGGYGTQNGFCQGDSGGPLVCNGKAVGVVSYNRDKICDYPDRPNVYTDISKYMQWINRILKRYK